jgi:hypothetical protein
MGRCSHMNSDKILPLKKEFYRIWFEFYKISLQTTNPTILKNLKQSNEFYSSWGDIEQTSFNDWWDSHKHLFEEQSVSILDSQSSRIYSDSLILEVPINQSTTVLLKKIRQLIDEQQKIRNRQKKKYRVITSQFQMSERSEPKLMILKDVLNVYRDVYLKDTSLRGKTLLKKVYGYYSVRKRKDHQQLPKTIDDRGSSNENDIKRVTRNLRRWIQWGDTITVNVSRGEFPGKY